MKNKKISFLTCLVAVTTLFASCADSNGSGNDTSGNLTGGLPIGEQYVADYKYGIHEISYSDTEIYVTENGKSDYKIVISTNP